VYRAKSWVVPRVVPTSPQEWAAPVFGASQQFRHFLHFPPLNSAGLSFLWQEIGTLLFYAHAIDNTLLVALGSLASAQADGTASSLASITNLLNYCATHTDAVVRFHASDMALHIHSNASYLSVAKARLCAGGYFFLSDCLADPTKAPPTHSPPPPFNGPVLVNCSIL
jgi:hypothetical protein